MRRGPRPETQRRRDAESGRARRARRGGSGHVKAVLAGSLRGGPVCALDEFRRMSIELNVRNPTLVVAFGFYDATPRPHRNIYVVHVIKTLY